MSSQSAALPERLDLALFDQLLQSQGATRLPPPFTVLERDDGFTRARAGRVAARGVV